MAPAETYKLAILRNPSGIAISDVSYLEPTGRRRPVFMGKVGDTIDLNRVDIPQYVRSLTQGTIRDMIKAGALVPVPQELGEKRLDEVLAALRGTLAKPQQLVNVGTPARVEVLEPGVQVAVGDGTIQPQVGSPVNSHLEPGMQVADNPNGAPAAVPGLPPTGEALQAGELPQTGQPGVTLDSMEAAQAEDAAAAAAPEEGATALSAPVTSWKAEKNLAQQEAYLKASTDVEFLKNLVEDPAEESARLKNVAKKRLAELKKGA